MSVTVYFPYEMLEVQPLHTQGSRDGDVRLHSFYLQTLRLEQQQHTRDVKQMPGGEPVF